MTDLTILFADNGVVNRPFAEAVRQELIKAIGELPVISLTATPLDFGLNIVDEGPYSLNNYYRQLLKMAKLATTPYIAFCENDTLYPDEHFRYRPKLDTFAYNYNRWNLYTWSEPPFYSLKQRKILATLIAPRELFIEAMEERFAKYDIVPDEWFGEPGRPAHESRLGITLRKAEAFETYNPIVVFSHPAANAHKTAVKRAGKIRALEIYYWGKAKDLRKMYEG